MRRPRRRRPGQCRRRPGRRRPADGRRARSAPVPRPWSPARPPRRSTAPRAPTAGSTTRLRGRPTAAGSNGARRRPSCSTAPACGRSLRLDLAAGARAMLGETRGARPAGLGRAHRARACCTTGSTSTAAGMLAWTRSSSAWTASYAAPAGRGRRARRGRGAGDLRLCRTRCRERCSISPAISLPPTAVRAGATVVNGAAGRPLSGRAIRLRCGAHSRCSGPAFARPPPGCRRSCRGSGMSEGTPCI